MLDTLFEIYNRRHADQNLLRVWWQMLEKYPMEIVSQSFNKWTSENTIISCGVGNMTRKQL